MALVWVSLRAPSVCFSAEGDVYKARTPSTDTRVAPEVTEEHGVPVDVPVDQVGSELCPWCPPPRQLCPGLSPASGRFCGSSGWLLSITHFLVCTPLPCTLSCYRDPPQLLSPLHCCLSAPLQAP